MTEKIRVGLIGCGGFARYRAGHLFGIAECDVVALADPDSKQIEEMRRAHGFLSGASGYSDYRTMLKESRLDAALIATPHSQHSQQIIECLDAGLHVLTEKPMVTTVTEALRVIQARDRAGKVGMVSYQRHFQPEYRWVREKIRSGEAGKVQFVQAVLGQNWKNFTTGTWRQDPEQSGGGMLGDSGSHMVDILLWLTGLEPSSVASYSENRETPVEINSTTSVRFKDGALGSISVVGDGHDWREEVTIWCDRMTFYIRGSELTYVDEKGNRFKADSLSGGSNPDRHFFDCVLGRAECESPFECGLAVVRLTQAAWESAETGGRPVLLG